jgi:hypothetical protein
MNVVKRPFAISLVPTAIYKSVVITTWLAIDSSSSCKGVGLHFGSIAGRALDRDSTVPGSARRYILGCSLPVPLL